MVHEDAEEVGQQDSRRNLLVELGNPEEDIGGS
jgi:hypothetical protein